MAKLDLTDITGGYQTATAYNANNTLVEAAMENTLSRDGTTPNGMSADLDMNSYDIDNVGSVSTTTLTLNGVVVTPDVGLVLALDASAVTFTPTGGSEGSLQDALDDDYNRNDTYVKSQTVTSTALNDVTDAINTAAGKVQGVMVYNTTTDNPVWAVGAADADVWVDGAGTTVNTPV